MAPRDWRILELRQEDLSLLILQPLDDKSTMSKPNQTTEPFRPVPQSALVGLANATVLGRWGVWSLPGSREERQAEAESRIRRGSETMGATQFETEAMIYEFRDMLS